MMLELNVKNETSKLNAVILWIVISNGPTPILEECYDPKSKEHVSNGTYPVEEDMTLEIHQLESVLLKYDVQIYRPKIIKNYNQIFTRDIGFVIDDTFIISNTLPERSKEISAIKDILKLISIDKVIKLPKNCHIEGGDVILHNNYIFIGIYNKDDYQKIKTARTNIHAVNFLKEKFPEKKIISFDLIKSDTDSKKNALHLDCCLQPVGNDKLVICPNAFNNTNQYNWITNYFGKHNILEISLLEMSQMHCNFFSIDKNIVISDKSFKKLNNWLRGFNIIVEEINYNEISKQGGLLRCSTLPLIRNNS